MNWRSAGSLIRAHLGADRTLSVEFFTPFDMGQFYHVHHPRRSDGAENGQAAEGETARQAAQGDRLYLAKRWRRMGAPEVDLCRN